MLFKIRRTSRMVPNVGETTVTLDPDYDIYEIEINTLQELLDLMEKAQDDIVISHPGLGNEAYSHEIEIYDDYRE